MTFLRSLINTPLTMMPRCARPLSHVEADTNSIVTMMINGLTVMIDDATMLIDDMTARIEGMMPLPVLGTHAYVYL